MVIPRYLHPCADLEIKLRIFQIFIPAFAAADMAALHIGAARHIRQFLIGQGGEQFFFLFGVEGLGVNGG